MSGQTGTRADQPTPPWPAPGALLERGRYRLLAEVGQDRRCGALLWQGRDLVLERDVALTLFTADLRDTAAEAVMRSTVQRALRSARLESSGAARVLDVLEPDRAAKGTPAAASSLVAAVVAEWTPGHDLAQVVRDGLPPLSVVARMLAPLAGAVDAAHRAGLVLGCDHPQRIRVTADGHARLAFPGPAPDCGPHDDIRGLGAALYLLLTGYWPLPASANGLPTAPRGPDGGPASPRSVRPDVPTELSTLAVRSLTGTGAGAVHTGAAVRQVLEHTLAAGNGSALLPDSDPNERPTTTPDDPLEENRRRRVKLGVSVTALVAATLMILGYAGMQLASIFSDDPGDGPRVVVGAPSDQPGAAPPPAPPAPPPPAGPVPVADLTVYDISGRGSPDNPEDVGLLVDGDPTTGWSTDSYFQPFPAFKQGLGVMLTFNQPVSASSVAIESPSAGTVLEVRAAPAPDAALDQTTLLGTATLDAGSTQIPLRATQPTRYLLLWITGLSGGGDRNQSELTEVGVQPRAI